MRELFSHVNKRESEKPRLAELENAAIFFESIRSELVKVYIQVEGNLQVKNAIMEAQHNGQKMKRGDIIQEWKEIIERECDGAQDENLRFHLLARLEGLSSPPAPRPKNH